MDDLSASVFYYRRTTTILFCSGFSVGVSQLLPIAILNFGAKTPTGHGSKDRGLAID